MGRKGLQNIDVQVGIEGKKALSMMFLVAKEVKLQQEMQLGNCCSSLSCQDRNVAKQPEQHTEVMVICGRSAFPMLLLPLMEDTAQLKKQKLYARIGAHYLHATSPTHTARSSDFPPEFPDEKTDTLHIP